MPPSQENQSLERSSLAAAGVALATFVAFVSLAGSSGFLSSNSRSVTASAAQSTEPSVGEKCATARNVAAARGGPDVPEVKTYPLGQQLADTCTAAILSGATANPRDPNSYQCVGKSARVLIDPEQGEITVETEPALYVEAGKCSTVSCTKPAMGGAPSCFPAKDLTNLGGQVQNSADGTPSGYEFFNANTSDAPIDRAETFGDRGDLSGAFNETAPSGVTNTAQTRPDLNAQLNEFAKGEGTSASQQSITTGSTFQANPDLGQIAQAPQNGQVTVNIDPNFTQNFKPRPSTFGEGTVPDGFFDPAKNAEGNSLTAPFSWASGKVNAFRDYMLGPSGPLQNNFIQTIGIRG